MPSVETGKTVHSSARLEELINLAFKREVLRRVTNVIVPLNDVGSGPSFYCVHSIAGVATEFQNLVRMLGPDQKFYGIQVPTNRRNPAFARSIKEMSRYYVDELVKFQPDGAFLLGGYSIGATIALEISQQLIARGREVGLLVVFDGELFNTGAEISARNPLYWLKLLLNVPRWIVDELMKNRRRFTSKTMARLKWAVFKLHTKKDRPARHPVGRFITLDGFLPGHAAFIKALYESHLEYVPDNYSGRVLVFVAKTQALLRLRQVRAAWTKIAPAAEVLEIDGTHLGIMKMPHGLPVAERLRRIIRERGGQTDGPSTSPPTVAASEL